MDTSVITIVLTHLSLIKGLKCRNKSMNFLSLFNATLHLRLFSSTKLYSVTSITWQPLLSRQPKLDMWLVVISLFHFFTVLHMKLMCELFCICLPTLL